MKITKQIILLAIAIISLTSCSKDKEDDPLVGRWEYYEKSTDGITFQATSFEPGCNKNYINVRDNGLCTDHYFNKNKSGDCIDNSVAGSWSSKRNIVTFDLTADNDLDGDWEILESSSTRLRLKVNGENYWLNFRKI